MGPQTQGDLLLRSWVSEKHLSAPSLGFLTGKLGTGPAEAGRSDSGPPSGGGSPAVVGALAHHSRGRREPGEAGAPLHRLRDAATPRLPLEAASPWLVPRPGGG